MTIGEVIQQYCQEHKTTYQQFADACGVTKGYISMLVNEKNPKTGKPIRPTIESYQAIANAMGMALDELFARVDDAPVALKLSASDDADEMIKQLENIRRDPDRGKMFRTLMYGDIDEIRRANAILDALAKTRRD